MSGIVERAERLRNLVVLSIQQKQLANDAEILAARISQLTRTRDDVRRLLPAARELKSAGDPSKVLADAGTLRRSAARALQDFRADPRSVRRPDATAINAFWAQAPQQIARIEATIRLEWQAHVNEAMPDYQPQVVQVLAGEHAPAMISELNQHVRQADGLARSLPADDGEAQQVRSIAQQMRAALSQFDLATMPEDVQAFIQAALKESAALDLLTPTVHQWLRERGIERNVRLSFADR